MRLIDSQAGVSEACAVIAQSRWAAVDTEADSLHHFVEKLCLLQISTEQEDIVIDTLASLNMSDLMSILKEKPLIFHASDFDLRMLKKFYGFQASEIFDTHIAAQLLGYERQGLADLALRHCSVTLCKKGQKADWSERPLKTELLEYAANDTHYLKPISQRLREELVSLGRIDWFQESCEKLLKTLSLAKEAGTVVSETAWQVKGSKKLDPRVLAVLKELWHWRQEEARRKDRPPFKVLNSETLIEIADWAHKNPGVDVELLPKAPRNVKREYREALNQILEKTKNASPIYFRPEKGSGEPKRKMNSKAKKDFEKLREIRTKIAESLKINPSLLATNSTLELIAVESPKSSRALESLRCLMNWQSKILGEGLIKVFTS